MNIFDESINWYKGNLHTHTTVSDGAKDPHKSIETYKNAGYDFIAITDHNNFNPSHLSDDFLVLSGIEFDLNDFEINKAFHIVGIGMYESVSFTRGMSVQEMIDIIKSEDGIAVIAHPAWSLLDHSDLMRLKGYDAIEIWNTFSHTHTARGDSVGYGDVISARGLNKLFLAVDDTHLYNEDLFGGYIMVNSKSLSTKSIKENILQGKFYCSQGPVIEQIEITDKKVTVKTSPVAQITFLTDTFYCADRITRNDDKTAVTKGSYTIKGTDTFIRIECVAQNGQKAWSQVIDIG